MLPMTPSAVAVMTRDVAPFVRDVAKPMMIIMAGANAVRCGMAIPLVTRFSDVADSPLGAPCPPEVNVNPVEPVKDQLGVSADNSLRIIIASAELETFTVPAEDTLKAVDPV